jgi:tRNA-specific 2-thiouridylase
MILYSSEIQEGISVEDALKSEARKIPYTPQMGKEVEEASRGTLFYYWTKRIKCRDNGSIIYYNTNVETNTIYTGLTSQHPDYSRKHCVLKR